MESKEEILSQLEQDIFNALYNIVDGINPFQMLEIGGACKAIMDKETQHLTDENARLKGELEEQTKLKQQWYNLYQNALK